MTRERAPTPVILTYKLLRTRARPYIYTPKTSTDCSALRSSIVERSYSTSTQADDFGGRGHWQVCCTCSEELHFCVLHWEACMEPRNQVA